MEPIGQAPGSNQIYQGRWSQYAQVPQNVRKLARARRVWGSVQPGAATSLCTMDVGPQRCLARLENNVFFFLYTLQTFVLLTAVNVIRTIVLLLQNLNKNRNSIFETTNALNNRQNRLKPLVISQCYNSLWLNTITLWTRGQRGDLGVIYCDFTPTGQSPMYANHSGLTLSVPFQIYHDQWGWNELPLDVLFPPKL